MNRDKYKHILNLIYEETQKAAYIEQSCQTIINKEIGDKRNMEIFENNIVKVLGEIVAPLTPSHEVFGEGFYETVIGIERKSEYVDLIPVIVSERLIDVSEDWVGQVVSIVGEFRSFNVHETPRNKLKLYIFAREIECVDWKQEHKNEIFLRAHICKEPTYRKTPQGREIADVLVAVNRGYGKSDYIPCICWGRNARYVGEMEVGTYVSLEGRVQSRDYVKRLEDGTEEVRTAFEVSVSKIEF